jgi:hypothetical protein
MIFFKKTNKMKLLFLFLFNHYKLHHGYIVIYENTCLDDFSPYIHRKKQISGYIFKQTTVPK